MSTLLLVKPSASPIMRPVFGNQGLHALGPYFRICLVLPVKTIRIHCLLRRVSLIPVQVLFTVDSAHLFIAAWFQKAAAAGSDNLVIYCSDTHLNNLAPGKFRDPRNGNSQVTIGNSNTACGGALRAFAYPASGRNAIVLCSDSGNGALRTYHSPTFGQWNTGGDFRLVNFGSINTFGVYLSYKILHELFHCADFQQCKLFMDIWTCTCLYWIQSLRGSRVGSRNGK